MDELYLFFPLGALKFGFWKRCDAVEFESRSIQIPIFQEKVTHSYTNWPNFEQNYPIFQKFS